MKLDFETYRRRSFEVEAVMITKDNIVAIADKIGELKEKDGKPYIVLDRRIVPTISRAYLGWWVTNMNDNIRVYAPRIFTDQFEKLAEQSADASGLQSVSGWFELPDEPADESYDVV